MSNSRDFGKRRVETQPGPDAAMHVALKLSSVLRSMYPGAKSLVAGEAFHFMCNNVDILWSVSLFILFYSPRCNCKLHARLMGT